MMKEYSSVTGNKTKKFNLNKLILVQIFVKCNILLSCMSLPVLES